MPKPVCVKCQCFYSPKKNGVVWEEGKPFNDEPHLFHEDGWSSYKLWRSDLWKCPTCAHEIIVGHANRNFAEHYQSDYSLAREKWPPYVFVKDC